MGTRTRPGAGTILMAAGGALAALLFAWFLSVYLTHVSGDAVVGQAFEALTALGFLWVVLLVLLALDRGLGGPSWPRRAGFLLVPVAGVATFFATDYPDDRLSRAGVIAMPLLIGAYLAAGRLEPRLAARVQAAILLPLAALCWYSIALFVTS
ncbi:MAG TPA: hypothetical protein VIC34_00255 [Croceibacterium sp.]